MERFTVRIPREKLPLSKTSLLSIAMVVKGPTSKWFCDVGWNLFSCQRQTEPSLEHVAKKWLFVTEDKKQQSVTDSMWPLQKNKLKVRRKNFDVKWINLILTETPILLIGFSNPTKTLHNPGLQSHYFQLCINCL